MGYFYFKLNFFCLPVFFKIQKQRYTAFALRKYSLLEACKHTFATVWLCLPETQTTHALGMKRAAVLPTPGCADTKAIPDHRLL